MTLHDLWTDPGQIPLTSAILFITITVFLGILVYIQTRKDHLDLRFLILDDTKKPSLIKIGQLVSLIVSTWAFIVLVTKDKLTIEFFTIYMTVWSASTALDKYLSRDRRDAKRQDDAPDSHAQ